MKQALAIIPARKGSIRLPDKNIRRLAGKELFRYTIDEANKASRITHTVFTSDAEEYLSMVENVYGEKIDCLLRPASLATAESPIADTIKWVAKQYPQYDYYVLLQVTSPLRRAEHIDKCMVLIEEHDADTVITLKKATQNPASLLRVEGSTATFYDEEKFYHQGKRETLYRENGAVYVMQSGIAKRGEIYGEHIRALIMEESESIDIDEIKDWNTAEGMLGGKNEDRS